MSNRSAENSAMHGANKGVHNGAKAGGPNMTPMVDVVMCILIFFMLGSAFLAPELILSGCAPANRNGVSTVPVNAPAPPVRLSLNLVRRDNKTWCGSSDGTMLPIDTSLGGTGFDGVEKYLAGKRAAFSDTVEVIIVPDKDVSYQDVITVYDACVHANFKQIAFAPARDKVE